MEMALPLAALGAKVESLYLVSYVLLGIGAVLFVVGWGWLIFQNARYSPLQGILSLIIPPWAILYAFYRMEHRNKSLMMTVCLGGIVWALLGYALVYAGWVCEADNSCLRRRAVQPAQEQTLDSSDSQLLLPAADHIDS